MSEKIYLKKFNYSLKQCNFLLWSVKQHCYICTMMSLANCSQQGFNGCCCITVWLKKKEWFQTVFQWFGYSAVWEINLFLKTTQLDCALNNETNYCNYSSCLQYYYLYCMTCSDWCHCLACESAWYCYKHPAVLQVLFLAIQWNRMKSSILLGTIS